VIDGRTPGLVYFIRPVGLDGPIKIGWTTRTTERLAQLSRSLRIDIA
jgi:hypothetical protein